MQKCTKQKYFDSGDYQMAKQKKPLPLSKSRLPPLVSQQPTGDEIPTPESVPVRKTSIIQQSKLTSTAS
ncbi:Alpha-endosulfine [Armadillidium vulgare]|nr:Alpha-endosulfine [Armadillidium vulgare]